MAGPALFVSTSTAHSAVEPVSKADKDGLEVQNWKIALS